MPNININNELKRNLSETYNYTMGAASNAVTSLISTKCQIIDSSVTECSISELHIGLSVGNKKRKNQRLR